MDHHEEAFRSVLFEPRNRAAVDRTIVAIDAQRATARRVDVKLVALRKPESPFAEIVDRTRRIAVLLEQGRQPRRRSRNRTFAAVRDHAVRDGILPRIHRDERRMRRDRRRNRPIERNAARSQRIDMRRRVARITVAAEMIRPLRVDNNQQNVHASTPRQCADHTDRERDFLVLACTNIYISL
ncbi:MAG: hypothetical protein NTU83_12895 [Candidatus Hydrogenedentes bacterium]|nr:hypothetical protein [Candidatus Hydrogenedentota bacterium]